MAIVVPDLGEQYMLDLMMRKLPTSGFTFLLGLYRNDYSPHRESVLANITPANFGGYAPIALARADWGPAMISGGVSRTIYGSGYRTWLASSGTQLVYGAYVTDQDANILLWAERFGAPQNVTTTVSAVYLPIMQLRSEFQPVP